MSARLAFVLLSGTLLVAGRPAYAHHSFAVFDTQHPLEIRGTIRQFKLTSPHSTIVLEVKGDDGSVTIWTLEGASASFLMRDGWSSQSLKSGDEVTLTIDPLRSGAPGGAWTGQQINFRDGRPVVCCVVDGF